MRMYRTAFAAFLLFGFAAEAQTDVGYEPQNPALMALLPEAQEGWTRDTESESILDWVRGIGSGAASAAYTDGSRRFIISFSDDPEKVASMSGLVNNPAMVQIRGGEVIDIGGIEFLFVNTQFLAVVEDRVSIETSISSDEIVANYLATIDFEALSKTGE